MGVRLSALTPTERGISDSAGDGCMSCVTCVIGTGARVERVAALLSTEIVGVSPEPEQPIRTVNLLYDLGCLGVICCILGHQPVLGEPTCQPTAYGH